MNAIRSNVNDAAANLWAAEAIGKGIFLRAGSNWGRSDGGNIGSSDSDNSEMTEGESLHEQNDYKIDPSVFANRLCTGGLSNDRLVNAVRRNGRRHL